jgi:hypothetical protein
VVRPLKPPPQPLSSYLLRAYRRLQRLAVDGPLWVPLAFGAVCSALVALLPLLGGARPSLDQPWRTLELIAAAFGVLVGVSAWPERIRVRRRRALRQEIDRLRAMPREEIAHLVGLAYRRARYEVVETGRGRGAGIDLELHNRSGLTLVQCRHYREKTIDMPEIRELDEVMRAIHAHAGVVVTTGEFTDLAQSYARVHHITTVDGRTLTRMVRVAEPGALGRQLAPD